MKLKVAVFVVVAAAAIPALAQEQPAQQSTQQQSEQSCQMKVDMALEAIKSAPDTGEVPSLHGLTEEAIRNIVATKGVCAAA